VQIIDNKALLLKTRHPERITTVIPKSKIIDENEVLVKWGLDEAQVLKNLRIKNVPSPINKDYEWTGMYKPFEHQKVTSSFLTCIAELFVLTSRVLAKHQA